MTRILALDVEALLLGATPAEVLHEKQQLLWLIDALRPHPDVRIVLLALRDRNGVSIEQLRLGELAGRVLGNTFNQPQQDALIAALRIDLQRAEHMVVATDSALVPDGDFNVLACPGGLGLAPQEVRTSLERWLSSTRTVVLSASTGKSPRGQGERVLYLDFDRCSSLRRGAREMNKPKSALLSGLGHQICRRLVAQPRPLGTTLRIFGAPAGTQLHAALPS